MTTMPATRKKPPRLAVAADRFATVDEEDFGFALYGAREWEFAGGVVRGYGSQKGVQLARLVADRMGLPGDQPVTHRDDDPLNCQRHNLYCTPYVWRRGTFNRFSVTTEYRTVGKGKKKREEKFEVETVHEETGWTYGNVAVYQGGHENGTRGGVWTLLHVPTGRTFGALWDRLPEAKLGVELMHVEADFSTIPDDGSFTPEMGAKWKDVVRRRGRGRGY